MSDARVQTAVIIAALAVAGCGGPVSVASDDSGVVTDSGLQSGDSATTNDSGAGDSGLAPADSGSIVDSGAPDSGALEDSGVIVADAGFLDTGVPVDASTMCPPGYERSGGACVLDEPPPSGLSLWLDGAATDSIELDGSNGVTSWSDRRSFIDLTVTPTASFTRPTFQPTGRNGRGALMFDGTDDQLALTGYSGLSATDYEIIFAGEPISLSAPNGIVGALSGTSDWAVMLDQHAGNDARLTHRRPPGTTGGETAVVDRTALVRPMYIAASHQSSATTDSLAIFAADEPNESTGVTLLPGGSAGIGGSLNLRIGRTQAGHMHGKIYEVLIYTRRLTVAERAEVVAYLRAKWNLP